MVRHTVVWAGVASRAHLIYAASWITALLDHEPGEVTVELMGSRTFFGDEAITPAVVADLLPDGVTVRPWPGTPADRDASLWLVSVGAVGIKPWVRLRAKNPTRRIPVIVTDEGLGSYGNWASRRQAYARQGVGEPWRTIRTSAVEMATRALATSRWPLHLETERGWSLNKPVADEFRRLAPTPERGDHVVFLSQPWPEVGVLDEAAYLAHVHEIAKATRTAGLEFLVLPHPGEPRARYEGFAYANGLELAEFNAVALGARAVVGASSTAMLNLAAIHGIPAARVGTRELADLDRRLAPRQASLLAHYAAPSLSPAGLGRRLSQDPGR